MDPPGSRCECVCVCLHVKQRQTEKELCYVVRVGVHSQMVQVRFKMFSVRLSGNTSGSVWWPRCCEKLHSCCCLSVVAARRVESVCAINMERIFHALSRLPLRLLQCSVCTFLDHHSHQDIKGDETRALWKNLKPAQHLPVFMDQFCHIVKSFR